GEAANDAQYARAAAEVETDRFVTHADVEARAQALGGKPQVEGAATPGVAFAPLFAGETDFEVGMWLEAVQGEALGWGDLELFHIEFNPRAVARQRMAGVDDLDRAGLALGEDGGGKVKNSHAQQILNP